MNLKQIGIGLVLADFVAFTGYVLYHYGYVGLWQMALSNAATIQLTIDLGLALALVSLWMWQDARERGVSVLPYLLLTMTVGSIGPLLYLFRRVGSERSYAAEVAPARVRHA